MRRNLPTNRVIVYSMDQQWQTDFVDIISLQKHNRGFRYLLTCIDILSKYAWAITLRTKRVEEIVKAFRSIFSTRKPRPAQYYGGTEFKNRFFWRCLKQEEVRFVTTHNNAKASVVKYFNHTLENKIWKYFSHNHTYRYNDVLDALLKSCNHTNHSSIKRTPVEVTSENESNVRFTVHGDIQNVKRKPCVFQPDNVVRVSKQEFTFEKGYETNFRRTVWDDGVCTERTSCIPN